MLSSITTPHNDYSLLSFIHIFYKYLTMKSYDIKTYSFSLKEKKNFKAWAGHP